MLHTQIENEWKQDRNGAQSIAHFHCAKLTIVQVDDITSDTKPNALCLLQ